MRKITALFLSAGMALSLCACSAAETKKPAERQIFAMDTVMQVNAWGEDGEAAVEETEQMLYQLEDLLSRTREESQVAALNRSAGTAVELDEELRKLIETAEFYTRETNGAFDITIAPVMDAWGFTTDTYQVPEKAEIQELLTHVGIDHIHMDGAACSLDSDTEIDLGGIAKGYASDRVAEIYAAHHVPRGMVYLGGNVLAWGDRSDGSPWRVGIQDPKHPENPDALVGILHLKDSFAITSGGYQRNFEENGQYYHHILNPATGYPADSGLTSVTVVADKTAGNGTMCDALSTALFIMGQEQALDYWRDNQENFDLVLVTEDNRVLITDGLKDGFQPMEESGYSYETVS